MEQIANQMSIEKFFKIKERIKEKRNIICLCVIVVWILSLGTIFVFPVVYQNNCKTRIYEDMRDKISSDVCKANIRIVAKVTQKAEGVASKKYGEIGCGVIIDHKDGDYYVLTAAHVVDGKTKLETGVTLDNAAELSQEYFIVPFGEPTYDMARKQSNEYVPVDDFYDKYQKASVHYISDECDIAVIKFMSDEEYPCLQLSENEIDYNDKIVIFGKSDEEGSLINYGKITSKGYEEFETHDGRKADKVLYHNAFEMPGYSGSAALNEEMKIVGINIGGGTDFLGRFKHGAMVPVSIIKKALEKWEY